MVVLEGRRRSLMEEIFREEEVDSPRLCIVIGPLASLPVTVWTRLPAVTTVFGASRCPGCHNAGVVRRGEGMRVVRALEAWEREVAALKDGVRTK